MTELFIKLIEHLISLIREGKANQNNLNEILITPLEEKFEDVHQSYLDTFEKLRYETNYQTLSYEAMHLLIDRLEQDIRISFRHREKLRLLNNELKKFAIHNEAIEKITTGIVEYFDTPDEIVREAESNSDHEANLVLKNNGVRTSLIDALFEMAENQVLVQDRNGIFSAAIDQLTEKLNRNYSKVAQGIVETRAQILR